MEGGAALQADTQWTESSDNGEPSLSVDHHVLQIGTRRPVKGDVDEPSHIVIPQKRPTFRAHFFHFQAQAVRLPSRDLGGDSGFWRLCSKRPLRGVNGLNKRSPTPPGAQQAGEGCCVRGRRLADAATNIPCA